MPHEAGGRGLTGVMAGRQPVVGIVRDVVVDVIEAIGDELAAVTSDESPGIHVRKGRRVGTAGSHQLWSFEFDGDLPVPPETPGRLVVKGRDDVPIVVLAVGDFDLVLGVDEDIGERITSAELSLDPWFILTSLRERLSGLAETGADVPLVEALLDLASDEPLAGFGHDMTAAGVPLALGDEQLVAAAAAAEPGLRFVWGPPGTGKTSTLAATVALLSADQRRVLVVAHANAAVDVAMARVADALTGTALLEDGKVLRVGVPHLQVARERTEILPDHIIARQQPELIERRDQLVWDRRALSGKLKKASTESERAALTAELADVRLELAEIERRLRDARVALVKDAVVIGTTLSRLVLDDLLWLWPSEAVVVDEASMSGLPFLLAIAMRGASTLSCFGDFRQLPPIAVSDKPRARHWFGRDVFELAGVVSRIEAGVPDPRLATLRTQFRMGAAIADVVSRFAYFGMLTTDDTAAARARDIAAVSPAAGAEIVIVDVADLVTSCLQDADPRSFSRLNLLSAALVTSATHRLLASGVGDVGVVCPYRAQARLLDALMRDESAVTVATTHRFQGSERDVLLLDLTDAHPQQGPSRLTGRDPDVALRLLNVGASRARGKLLIVADLAFVRERHPSISQARRLLDLAVEAGAVTISAGDFLADVDGGPSVEWAASWEEAVTGLLNQGGSEPTHVDVSVAVDDHAGPWLDALVDALPSHGKTLTVRSPAPIAVRFESSAADLRLRTLGPAPLAFVGDSAMAVGSVDPARPAARITSEAFVAAARRLLLAE